MGIRSRRRRARRRSEDAAAQDDQQTKKMKKTIDSTAPWASLPDDLVMEIFLRLPARSVARLRCACRSWNAGTSSAAFLHRHHALAAAKLAFVPLASAHTYTVRNTPLRHGPLTLRCLRCPRPIGAKPCRGVVLFKRDCATTSTYSVCNPTTGEVSHLPPSHQKLGPFHHVTGIGFDAATGEYKVVQVSVELENLHARVLTLGDSRGWRALADGELAAFFTENAAIEDHLDPVFADGCLHWSFKTHYLYADQPQGVLSFSLVDESFRRVVQPPFITADLVPYDGKQLLHDHLMHGLGRRSGSDRHVIPPVGTMLAELDDRLCIVRDVRRRNDVPGQFEVWKLEDYETGSWSLDYRIDLTGSHASKQLTRPWLVVPLSYLAGYDGPGKKRKMLLATTDQVAHIYDPEANALRTVASLDDRGNVSNGNDSSAPDDEGDEFLRLVLYQESLIRFAGTEQSKGEITFVNLD